MNIKMKRKYILITPLLLSALCLSACEDAKERQVTIEFMHSSVEQERQVVINQLIAKFEQENPQITIKPVPVEEDAYNTKVITLARTGALPAVIEVSHDYAKVMDQEQLIDRDAIRQVIDGIGADQFYPGVLRIVRTEEGKNYTGVPIHGWIQGIWYNKSQLADAGFSAPQNWQDVTRIATAFNQPARKKIWHCVTDRRKCSDRTGFLAVCAFQRCQRI